MQNTLLRTNLHKETISYYTLHTTAQILYTTIYGILHETKNSTIYSIVSTNYYIMNLSK